MNKIGRVSYLTSTEDIGRIELYRALYIRDMVFQLRISLR